MANIQFLRKCSIKKVPEILFQVLFLEDRSIWISQYRLSAGAGFEKGIQIGVHDRFCNDS